MLTVILPDQNAEVRDRLGRIGVESQEVGGGEALPLEASTAEQVWLIPEKTLSTREWPRLRVDLAAAPRHFVVLAEKVSTATVVAAMRDGAFDVLAGEDDDARWLDVLQRAAESQRLWLRLYSSALVDSDDRLVGRSMAMAALKRDLERLGPTDMTVLLLGESGVGKERVAMALHEAGRGGPLVTLNCAAMPRELLEAELFGAEKGAFTGAIRARPGLVEQAAGGTLFLDEVGEMDIALQPKLLRFLETRRARRVGGEGEYEVRLRVIAATNRDLEQAVAAGGFRPDLYYRLAEMVLRVPPLRERQEDIPALARTFMAAASQRFGKHFDSIEPELLSRMRGYSWPGNVRELKSAVDRMVLLHDGPVLRSGWWSAPSSSARDDAIARGHDARDRADDGGRNDAFPSRSARLERARQMLAEGKLSLAEISARVGVHPTTLFRWRKSGRL
jgi:DNA-binding NtrC family response regulator